MTGEWHPGRIEAAAAAAPPAAAAPALGVHASATGPPLADFPPLPPLAGVAAEQPITTTTLLDPWLLHEALG